MNRRRLSIIAGLCCASALLGRGAAAQSGAADSLFQAARAAMKRGDLAHACPWFRESNRLEPAAGTELNLGLCEEQAGHLVEAWQLFRTVAAILAKDDPRFALADAHANGLDSRIARLTLTCREPLAAGTRIRIDESEYTEAVLGASIPLDPGERTVEVRAPGREARGYVLELEEGAQKALEIAPGAPLDTAEQEPDGPAAPPVVLEPRPESPAANPRTTTGSMFSQPARPPAIHPWMWEAALGLSGAAFLAAGITGLEVLHAKQMTAAHCNSEWVCSPEGVDAARRGKTFATWSTISFVTGLGAAAGAAVLYWAQRSKPQPQEPAAPSAGIQLGIGPGNVVLTADF